MKKYRLQLLDSSPETASDSGCHHYQCCLFHIHSSYFEFGRILVRKSGTEPLLRVMVEALTDELCEEHVLHVINAMKGTL